MIGRNARISVAVVLSLLALIFLTGTAAALDPEDLDDLSCRGWLEQKEDGQLVSVIEWDIVQPGDGCTYLDVWRWGTSSSHFYSRFPITPIPLV